MTTPLQLLQMIDDAVILKAVQSVRQAAPRGSRIVVFGSCAKGGVHSESDIDLLVIEPEVENVWREMVRLRKAIGRIGVPVDVLVTDAREFEFWKDTPTTIQYEAATKGRTYDSLA